MGSLDAVNFGSVTETTAAAFNATVRCFQILTEIDSIAIVKFQLNDS